jgi:hypothetical protein
MRWVSMRDLEVSDPDCLDPIIFHQVGWKNPDGVLFAMDATHGAAEMADWVPVYTLLPSSLETDSESNLVAHARQELQLIGEDRDIIEGYLRVIQAFAAMGHSGTSAMIAIPVINNLLQYKNLKPLTDDPEEWLHHGQELWGQPGGLWQNRRNSAMFSTDGGKTYYCVEEKHTVDKPRKIYTSEHKEVAT